jgi:hypothetical protein
MAMLSASGLLPGNPMSLPNVSAAQIEPLKDPHSLPTLSDNAPFRRKLHPHCQSPIVMSVLVAGKLAYPSIDISAADLEIRPFEEKQETI